MRRIATSVVTVAAAVVWAAAARAAEMPAGRQHVNSAGMKLVRVEAGDFVMGQGEAAPKSKAEWAGRDWDESPAHEVTIGRTFYLGACEVTNAQYERFAPGHKDLRGKKGATRNDDDPATFVTWQEAADFCGWLSKAEGLPYRLPTEAEWEYACRAGTTTAYHTGDAITAEQANLGRTADGKRRDGAAAAGSFPPNAWGLFDMHGNAAEWCADWFGPYEAGDHADPVGRADGDARVVRGWSYLTPAYQDAARFARSANRSAHVPDDANRYTGFRVALGPPPDTRPLPPAEPPLHRRDVKQAPAPAGGPAADKPYFVNYTAERKNATIPPETWGPVFSQWNHFAAVCVCPNGDVLAAWYTTVGESDRGLAQAASRLRAGSDRWDPASLFFGVADVNCHAPVLLSDGKRMYHFCTQSLAGWDDASEVVRTSDDSGATWSKPRVILPRHAPGALSQPCSALIVRGDGKAGGEIVLACDGDNHRDERLLVSRDRGENWAVAAGDMRKAAGAYAIHPAVVQRDGGELITFLRGPDPMPMLVSADLGETWKAERTPFPGIGVGQKAAAIRLASGNVLLCSIDRTKALFGGGTFAALSPDGGRTWPHVRKLDGVGGYMSAAQAPNGVVYVVGSRTGAVAFNEAWVKGGAAGAKDADGREGR